jgi:predicted dehydrogenase
MNSIGQHNRREFLTRTSAAVGAFAAPYFVSASAIGATEKSPPSDRIVMGVIGTGGMGQHDMGVFLNQPDSQVVAVCDVDAAHRAAGANDVNTKYGNSDCKAYDDFRELLARDDIDAVAVVTPDHWHALIAIAAANAGKDIYCEKPLANSVAEGRGICRAVERNGRVLQTGSHERSTDGVRRACELVRNGRLGELHTIRVQMPCEQDHHNAVRAFADNADAMPVPAGFEYDNWLGPAANAPYHEKRCHFWWRFNMAYGGGEMTDRGAHIIDIAQLALGMDNSGPVEYHATGKRVESPLYDTFLDFQFENRYANGTRLLGTNHGPRGIHFVGTEGWLFVHVHGGDLEAGPASLLDDLAPAAAGVDLGRSPGHHRNFLDCVKTRETPLASAEIGHRTATICHLNNISMQLGRPIKWDPAMETIHDDAEASAMLRPTMRSPWSLT